MKLVPRPRRAFALPLVVMITAVLGVVIGYMLSRQSTQALTVERQINSYREHHNGRGMQELIDGYLKTVRDRDVARFIAPDGKALDVELPGGGTLSVYLSDGQGQPLDPNVAGADRSDAENLLAVAPEGTQTRSFGSIQVSINSASQETLIALGNRATNGRLGAEFAGAVVAARQAKPIAATDVDHIAQNAGMSPDQLNELHKYITAEPTVWLVETRLIPGSGPAFGGRRTPQAFRAYAALGAPRNANAISSVWTRRSALHDWKELPKPTTTGGPAPIRGN